jgi:predicted AlkP superfamily pyrophosphatase or phosphodiesterase
VFAPVPLFLSKSAFSQEIARPRLVVLIVVDQMRSDLLDRFAPAFKKDSKGQNEGFLFLRSRGMEFANARTAGVPSVTAAGHASLCTGANPGRNGIVGNDFFDRSSRRKVESTFDSAVRPVITSDLKKLDPLSNVPSFGSSARNLKVPSLAAAFDSFAGGKSRTLSISLKDRGAVFCAGKNSVGTYWYDYVTGGMSSSTAFTASLPAWVDDFNRRQTKNRKNEWTPIFSQEQMQQLLADQKYKAALQVRSSLSKRFGNGLPYRFAQDKEQGVSARNFFQYTPAASDFLVDFALESVRQERLGCSSREASKPCVAGKFPDLLTISFSTPDLVGHAFGGESPELMDIYLNLNRSLARFTGELERQLGQGQILYVLSADHGVQPMPEVLISQGKKVERLKPETVVEALESELVKVLGEGPWVETISTAELYLNRETMTAKNANRERVVELARSVLLKMPGVRNVLGDSEMSDGKTLEARLYRNGHDPSRSGDLKIVTQPGWLWGNYNAANHGTAYDDDTRIPVLFSGWNVAKGRVMKQEIFADDVAPTILGLIGASVPPSMTGRSFAKEVSR